MKNLMSILSIISVCLVLLGAVCKLQHWPGGQIMLAIGMIGIVITSIVRMRAA